VEEHPKVEVEQRTRLVVGCLVAVEGQKRPRQRHQLQLVGLKQHLKLGVEHPLEAARHSMSRMDGTFNKDLTFLTNHNTESVLLLT
jgi:hypothetical protein